MKYEFVKSKGIYTTVVIKNEQVVFEKKDKTESTHDKIEAWNVHGLVKNNIKYVAVAYFEKWNENFITLNNIEKY